MSSDSNRVPGLRSLYWSDSTIHKAVTPMILGLMLAAGMWWMTQPMPNADPKAVPSPEVRYAPWGIAAGLAVTVLAGGVLVWRYLRVRKILGDGLTVRGIVELSERFDTNSRIRSDRIQTTPTYTYYVTIGYAVHGIEHKVRLRLPHSPGTYGIKQDGEVDLRVLDYLPRQPLIRAVYDRV